MGLNKSTRQLRVNKIANAGFVLLFPVFYFYHYAQALGYSPVQTGLFGIVSLLLIPLFAIDTKIIWGRINLSPAIGGFFTLLIIWVSLWTAIHWFWWYAGIPTEAFQQVVELVLSWIALFLVGLFIDPESKWVRRICFYSLFGMAALAAVYIDPRYLLVNPQSNFRGAEGVPSYQAFTRSVMFTGMIIVATTNKGFLRLALICFVLMLVFIHGGRSEFFGLVAAFAAFEVARLTKERLNLFWIGLGLLVLTFFAAANWEMLMQSRQLQVFDLSNASSWIARQTLEEGAWGQLYDNLVFGVFAGHFLVDDGHSGTYAHNFLSAWVSFGLPGFLIYFTLSACAFLVAASKITRRNVSATWRLAFYVSGSSFLLVIVAKAVFWPMVAVGWGLIANATMKDRMRRNSSNSRKTYQRLEDVPA